MGDKRDGEPGKGMKIKRKLQEMRQARRYSQQDLADAVRTTQSQIQRFESTDCTAEPRMSLGLKIARVLGVPMEYLADDEMDEVPVPNDQLSFDQRWVLAAIEGMPMEEVRRRLLQVQDVRPAGGFEEDRGGNGRGGARRRGN